MPAKEVINFGTIDTLGVPAQGSQDGVGGGVADGVTEDVFDRGVGVSDDFEGGFEVVAADCGLAVEQGIDEGDADRLGFGAGGQGNSLVPPLERSS